MGLKSPIQRFWRGILEQEFEALFRGYGYKLFFITGGVRETMHQEMAALLDLVYDEIRAIQKNARETGDTTRPIWPMIVMKTPKGWTGPKVVDGKPVEGTWRAHQVPIADVRDKPEHLHQLEKWMRSYRPEELFDENGQFKEE